MKKLNSKKAGAKRPPFNILKHINLDVVRGVNFFNDKAVVNLLRWREKSETTKKYAGFRCFIFYQCTPSLPYTFSTLQEFLLSHLLVDCSQVLK